MGRRVIIISLLFTFFCCGFAQQTANITFSSGFEKRAFELSEHNDPRANVNLLLSTDQSANSFSSENVFLQLNELTNASNKAGTYAKLRRLHNRIHSRLYRSYDEQASFAEVFTKGKYNCLSSTALMALALEELHQPYQIYCTTTHTFLVVELRRASVILETTNKSDGVIYTKNFKPGIDCYPITLSELAGLQYYNLALRELYSGDEYHAKNSMKKAKHLCDLPFVNLPKSMDSHYLSQSLQNKSTTSNQLAIDAYRRHDFKSCLKHCESSFDKNDDAPELEGIYVSALLHTHEGRMDHQTLLNELTFKANKFPFLENYPIIQTAKSRLYLCLAITAFEDNNHNKGSYWLTQFEECTHVSTQALPPAELIDWAYEAASSCYVRMSMYTEAIESLKSGLLVNQQSESLERKLVVYSDIIK